MEYLEFLDQIKECVQEKIGHRAVVTVSRVVKNNRCETETMTILTEGENCSPVIYLDQFYANYKRGASIEELADQILRIYHENFDSGNLDISFYTDFSKAKERIVCRVINYEKNKELLEQIPHRQFMDLAIVYYCKVDHEQIGKGSILIYHSHMESWGIGLKQLDDIALSNTIRLLPYDLIDMADMLRDTFHISVEAEEYEKFPMYILTNTEKYYGAVHIIFDSVLEAVAEKLESDFYILPSSIHECMIVPALPKMKPEDLRQMVCEINAEHVAAEEVLGEMVYRYDRADHRMYLP